MLGGTHGNILHIDLTRGETHIEHPPEEFYRLLVGGRAVIAYLLLRELPEGIDALSPDNLIRSIKEGAHSYVPKDKLPEIADFLRDILEAKQRGAHRQGRWFWKLKPFFDKVFGSGWREKDRAFWNDFDAQHTVSKKDLEDIL